MYLQKIQRLIVISWVLMRHGLDDLILATHLFRPLRFLRFVLPWLWMQRAEATRGLRIRRALEDLGPIFIKFGQILSTRKDLLPEDIAVELAKLQDQVPPFADSIALSILEKTYQRSPNDVFAEFSSTPFASASIAQVHAAKLHSGEEVVVKILRPGIMPIIKRDVAILYSIARKIERYWSLGKKLRPIEIVTEYEKTIINELNLMREAANATQLRSNFKDSKLLYVPEIHWDYTRQNVMVMERIHGISVSHTGTLEQHDIDFKQLAEHGVEIFFTQVFRDSFFHADMHPGNIFVAKEDQQTPPQVKGQYIAVDFGIMGTLTKNDQRYLAENFLAFFNHDYRRVAELHINSGWVGHDTRIEEFEAAIRTVCEPIFNKPLKEISFAQVLLGLFNTAREFDITVQPQLILLQKTLLNIEGLGRQLYPDLDLWQTAKPFLEKWMHTQIGPKAIFKQFKDNFPLWLEQMPQLPALVHDVLVQAKEGKLTTQLSAQQMKEIKQTLHKNNQRTFIAIIGSSLVIGASVIFALDGYGKFMIEDIPLATWVLGALGVILLINVWPSSSD
ncbi:Ubiquinone biosynthesis regulatory protein kinase UbiB [hydrothermal vent metagenome]|uniref:Ubiquinone biosynthesis regulatory protein kinase UbiB n=1 Tax=hydrothermal vent metagenome TaxID=652676 RepID=A0A3B1AFM6_9ZZZZ